MDLTSKQLMALSEIAKNAALLAGEIVARKQGHKIKVKLKEGGENIASCIVTAVDLQAEAAILEILGPTIEEYELGYLTEESCDDGSRFEKDYFWCIDPLDGTLFFSRNEDGYSISIALVAKSGEPIIGVVFNPRINTLYHAIKGHGAFKNNGPLKIKETNKNFKDLTLLIDASYTKNPCHEDQIKKIKLGLKGLGLVKLNIYQAGGAVMNGINTIEMAPALYYKLPKKIRGGGSIWDFAASSIIQSEAGGVNCDYYNRALELNRHDTTFMNHKGVVYCSSKKILDGLSL